VCVCVRARARARARACERASVGGWETQAVLVKLAARWRHLQLSTAVGALEPQM